MRLLIGVAILALGRPALADPPSAPTLNASISTTSSNRPEETAPNGLEIRWLPLESRASVTDFVGRNVAGAALDPAGRLLLGGGRAGDTFLLVDGFHLRRLSVPLGFVATVEVTTAGQGTEWADVPGGLLELHTRSEGDRRWHAGLDAYHDFRDPRASELAPMVAGPLVRDRLFFSLALRGQDTHDAHDQITNVDHLAPRQTGALGGALKLTWLPRAGHRLESLTLLDGERTDDLGTLQTLRDAQYALARRDLFTGLRWVATLRPALRAWAQAGFEDWRDEEMPQQCRDTPDTCESTPAAIRDDFLITSNWIRHLRRRGSGLQLSEGIEARLPAPPWLEPRLRVTSRLEARRFSWALHVPGDRVLRILGPSPELNRETVTFANDPRLEPAVLGWRSFDGSSLTATQALELEARLHQRLSIVPGLALVTSSARARDLVELHDLALAPQLTAAWDATGDGRTWLRAGAHQRVDANLAPFAEFALGTPVNRTCSWDEATRSFSKDCVVDAGRRSLGLPCSPTAVDGAGASCARNIRMPRSRELTLGAERELLAGLRLGTDLVYRRTSGLPDAAETNRDFQPSGSAEALPRDFRNGRAETVSDASSDPRLYQRYLGATVSLRRQVGALKLLVAYTESRHRGSQRDGAAFFVNTPPAVQGLPYSTGTVGDERRHSLRAMAGYDLRGYAWLGALFSAESAPPSGSIAVPQVGGPAVAERSPVGVNPRAPDRAAAIAPYGRYRRLNLQARLRGRRALGVDLDLYADLINVLDADQLRYVGPNGILYPAQDRRFFRLGLEYRY